MLLNFQLRGIYQFQVSTDLDIVSVGDIDYLTRQLPILWLLWVLNLMVLDLLWCGFPFLFVMGSRCFICVAQNSPPSNLDASSCEQKETILGVFRHRSIRKKSITRRHPILLLFGALSPAMFNLFLARLFSAFMLRILCVVLLTWDLSFASRLSRGRLGFALRYEV